MNSPTWVDLTVRPQVEAEVEIQPDGGLELSWPLPDNSRLTVLLRLTDAAALSKRLDLLLLLVE